MAALVNEGAIKRQFGSKVKLLRKGKGLSQEEVALEAELDLTTVNEIEMGRRNPTLVTVHRLSVALNTDPAKLIS